MAEELAIGQEFRDQEQAFLGLDDLVQFQDVSMLDSF